MVAVSAARAVALRGVLNDFKMALGNFEGVLAAWCDSQITLWQECGLWTCVPNLTDIIKPFCKVSSRGKAPYGHKASSSYDPRSWRGSWFFILPVWALPINLLSVSTLFNETTLGNSHLLLTLLGQASVHRPASLSVFSYTKLLSLRTQMAAIDLSSLSNTWIIHPHILDHIPVTTLSVVAYWTNACMNLRLRDSKRESTPREWTEWSIWLMCCNVFCLSASLEHTGIAPALLYLFPFWPDDLPA